MQIAQALAGYSLGDADHLRRAMGKKKAEEMAQGARALPRGRASSTGIGRGKRRTTIFDQMETFAAYGFNKTHSAAYALITVPDGVPEGALPASSSSPALLSLEAGDTDKDVQEHRRVPRARHPGAAARREREPRRLHRRATKASASGSAP